MDAVCVIEMKSTGGKTHRKVFLVKGISRHDTKGQTVYAWSSHPLIVLFTTKNFDFRHGVSKYKALRCASVMSLRRPSTTMTTGTRFQPASHNSLRSSVKHRSRPLVERRHLHSYRTPYHRDPTDFGVTHVYTSTLPAVPRIRPVRRAAIRPAF